MIIETPHSFFDLGTLGEGLSCVPNYQCTCFFASGTHRCASDTHSPCSGQTLFVHFFSSGKTSALATWPIPIRLFSTPHIWPSQMDSLKQPSFNSIFLDPGASVSNGKRHETTPDTPSARLTSALTQSLPDGGHVLQ